MERKPGANRTQRGCGREVSDRLKVLFSDAHVLTVDGPEALDVYQRIKVCMSNESKYFEMDHDDKKVTIAIDKVRTMEYVKGE